MRIAILCQEEPVFLGPFLQGVIRMRPASISAVVIAGARSAGERRSTLRARLESIRIFWLIFEPRGFLDAAWRRLRARVLGPKDPASVERCARRHEIPVRRIESRPEAVESAVAGLDADVVLNQSEILLTPRILNLPRVGFVNRHATLLPDHRGRLGSFWSHGDEPPCYGITIHMVDEGIDTGDVLCQWRADDVDCRWPFPRVLRHLNERAPALFWQAMDRLERGDPPERQPEPTFRPHRFPTLEDARRYRSVLSARRSQR